MDLIHASTEPMAAPQREFLLRMRCPSCRQRGAFRDMGHVDYLFSAEPVPTTPQMVAGVRVCPDYDCRCVVFFPAQHNEAIVTYPAETLDFDSSELPQAVADALAEAIKCHAAQCYVAAGMMMRKTLEEVCRDRGAKGNNLMERVKALGKMVVLPTDLLNGLDDLRLLGNDAAHVDSRTFQQVGKKEVEICIEVTKEMLKSVYQYRSLIGRVQALKAQLTS